MQLHRDRSSTRAYFPAVNLTCCIRLYDNVHIHVYEIQFIVINLIMRKNARSYAF